MVLPSMYPVAPATRHPTASPTMILAFLRNGDPKSSVRIMLTKERNPRPMNCGEPHLPYERHYRLTFELVEHTAKHWETRLSGIAHRFR